MGGIVAVRSAPAVESNHAHITPRSRDLTERAMSCTTAPGVHDADDHHQEAGRPVEECSVLKDAAS